MKTTTRMIGVKEFDDKLKQMERRAGNRIALSTLKAGGNAAVKAIKSVSPKWLKPAIGKKIGGKKRFFEAKVGVNVGKQTKKRVQVAWAAAQVVGTKARFRKMIGGKFSYIKNPTKAQLSTGKEKANPVVKLGMSSGKGAILAAMKKKFDESLAKQIAKAQLKGK